MKKYEEKVFQELPSFAPKLVQSYSSDKTTIFNAKNVFSEPRGFDSYKFHLIKSSMPNIKIEKKLYSENINSIFPFNPCQIHSYSIQSEVPKYIAFFIEKELMKEIAKVIYKKNNVFFKTENFPLDPYFENLINVFIDECNVQQPGYEFLLQSLNIQIAVYLLRKLKCNFNQDIYLKTYKDQRLVEKVTEYFNENMSADFTLNEVAKEVNYSPYHFIRIFKSHTGKTPFEYLLDMKIEKAKKLLITKDNNIIEIGMLCGFKDRTHFSTTFRKKVGISPSQYRKLVK